MLGEEVGRAAGVVDRRWILDGIDGTHNYADGRPGWGTIIALEIDGTVELGMVSAPLWGRRWWAMRGEGSVDRAPMRGRLVRSSRGRTVAVRQRDVARRSDDHRDPVGGGRCSGGATRCRSRFTPPESLRSQCFALDAAMVAEGKLDASIIVLGGIWDFAATSLIVPKPAACFATRGAASDSTPPPACSRTRR